jgi:hypothetical protein
MGWLNPLSGDGYQFWSGIGGGSPIFLLVILWWRRHNCHMRRCPWLQWATHPDNGHPVCKKHHPDDPPRLHRDTGETIGETTSDDDGNW